MVKRLFPSSPPMKLAARMGTLTPNNLSYPQNLVISTEASSPHFGEEAQWRDLMCCPCLVPHPRASPIIARMGIPNPPHRHTRALALDSDLAVALASVGTNALARPIGAKLRKLAACRCSRGRFTLGFIRMESTLSTSQNLSCPTRPEGRANDRIERRKITTKLIADK